MGKSGKSVTERFLKKSCSCFVLTGDLINETNESLTVCLRVIPHRTDHGDAVQMTVGFSLSSGKINCGIITVEKVRIGIKDLYRQGINALSLFDVDFTVTSLLPTFTAFEKCLSLILILNGCSVDEQGICQIFGEFHYH